MPTRSPLGILNEISLRADIVFVFFLHCKKWSRPNVVSENACVQRRSARLGLVLRPHLDLTQTSPRPHMMGGCYLYGRSRLGLENRPNVVKHLWE